MIILKMETLSPKSSGLRLQTNNWECGATVALGSFWGKNLSQDICGLCLSWSSLLADSHVADQFMKTVYPSLARESRGCTVHGLRP